MTTKEIKVNGAATESMGVTVLGQWFPKCGILTAGFGR